MAQRHPRSVYRRRRIVALAIVLIPAALVVRALGGTHPATAPLPGATPTVSASSTDTATVTSSPGTGVDSRTAAGATPTASATRSRRASATPSPIATLGTGLTASASASASTSTSTKARPKPTRTPVLPDCLDRDLSISVFTDAATYPMGNPVTIAMRISNTGTTDCMRDIGSLPNEVWVTDANGVLVWTSDACQASATSQVVDMKPGRVFGNTQVWNGTNSGRTCTTTAPPAPAGSYIAYARNNQVTSKGYAFTIG